MTRRDRQRQGEPEGIDGTFPHFTPGTGASSEVAAARERLGRPGRLIAHDEVESVRISRAEYDPGRLADLLASDAVLHGVTQELSSAVSYELAQRWAAASGRPRPARAVDSSRPMADVLQESGCDVLSHPSSRDLSPLLD